MSVSAGKYNSETNHPGSFSTALRKAQGIIRWLVDFFSLTETDRLQAGIYLGGEGRDE